MNTRWRLNFPCYKCNYHNFQTVAIAATENCTCGMQPKNWKFAQLERQRKKTSLLKWSKIFLISLWSCPCCCLWSLLNSTLPFGEQQEPLFLLSLSASTSSAVPMGASWVLQEALSRPWAETRRYIEKLPVLETYWEWFWATIKEQLNR